MKQHEFIPDDIILFLRTHYSEECDDFASSMNTILWDFINWAIHPLGYKRTMEDKEVFRVAYCVKSDDEAYAILRMSKMYRDWVSSQVLDEFNPQCIQLMKQTIEEL